MLSLLRRHKVLATFVVLAILAAGWYLFRPEKLFINQRVNEAAPFRADSAAQPIFTGTFTGKLHDTTGRATVYRETDGTLMLRLTNFRTSNGPDVHVVLASPNDPSLKSGTPGKPLDAMEVGALKGNEGDQAYKLPSKVDLVHYSTVAIYCQQFRAVFGTASLEAF